MNYFFDENFPKAAQVLLTGKKSKLFDVRGSKKEGLRDKEIFHLALKEEAIFCTTDKDYLTQIHLSQKPHYGILIIALSQPNSKSIMEKFSWFIDKYSDKEVNNKCFYLTDNACKIYE